MAGRMPERGRESRWTYDDRSETIIAILVVLLLDAAIIGLFMFITWVAYAAD